MFKALFPQEKPLAGLLKLLPLPGATGAQDARLIVKRAEQEAAAWISGGVNALLVENSYDYRGASLDAAGVALLTLLIKRLQTLVDVPIGLSVQPNDPVTALGIAVATDLAWIRLPLAVGARVTSTGMVEGQLAALNTYRKTLPGAERVAVLADVSLNQLYPDQSVSRAVDGAPDRVGHLLNLIRHIEALGGSEGAVQALLLRDADVSCEELTRLQSYSNLPVWVWNTQHLDVPVIKRYHDLASGLLMDAGVYKPAKGDLPPSVDMVKVEDRVSALLSHKSVEELGADFFVGPDAGRPNF